MTLLEAIQKSTEYLEKKGIESARTNAELLLASILDCTRMNLYLSFDRPLSKEETDKYRDLIVRRSKFEPLQYIIGEVEFYGLKFKVNPKVLIPRPETEFLIETITEKYCDAENLKILDLGTGSGNIAVSLARNLKYSSVTAIDFSQDIIDIAVENSRINEVSDRIEFFACDLEKEGNLPFGGDFDVIVSNPPYVSIDSYSSLQREISEYEPKAAVTDMNDGYKFYRLISNLSASNLKRGGCLFFELGENQYAKVRSIMIGNGFSGIESKNDLAGIVRLIWGVKN